MTKISPKNIALFNENLRYETPEEIISFTLGLSNRPLVSTSFGTYSAALLHATYQHDVNLSVLWCDTGYNLPETYAHAQRLQERFSLQLEIATPPYTTAYMNAWLGAPSIDNPNHERISTLMKTLPFKSAIDRLAPDLWFTNLRKGQTAHRDQLNILSFTEEGILKVCPFYHFSDEEMDAYLKTHHLPKATAYYDPIKALENRECGIHLPG